MAGKASEEFRECSPRGTTSFSYWRRIWEAIAGLQLHPPNQNSTRDVIGWVEDFIFKQQLVYDFFFHPLL